MDLNIEIDLKVAEILEKRLDDIEKLDLIYDFPAEKKDVINEINKIIFKLVMFNHDHFYSSKDIITSYALINNEIWRMNDTLVKLQSQDLIYEIYDIITDIIYDILHVCLEKEKYEMLKNIQDIFNYWVNTLKSNGYIDD